MHVSPLILAGVILTALSVAVAGVSIVNAAKVSSRERAALIRFVCESVVIREETGDPAASVYRQRFDHILADLGDHPCPKGATP